jgi:hyaluronan synthase
MNKQRVTIFLTVGAIILIGIYHLFNPIISVASVGIYLAVLGLGFRMLLASTNEVYEDLDDSMNSMRLGLIVPFYNEDPQYFTLCLRSIGQQERHPDVVWLIDDHSTSLDCLEIAHKWSETQAFDVKVRRVPENVGKRHAQELAFLEDTVDIWMTCDSDTILDELAISEGLKPLSDPRVHGVAGLTLAANWRTNILTRLIDVEFVNSFLIGRASLSRFGSVMVACGAIAFYRSEVIMEHLDDYLGETFLGSKIRAGDDRKLTQYCLLEGRMVYQESSRAYSALPENMSHLIRQRVRWSASFYRAIVWMMQNMPKRRIALWMLLWQVVELLLYMMVFVAFAFHIASVWLPAMLAYAIYMAAISYFRSIRFLFLDRKDMTTRDKAISVAISPLISLLYTFVLTPVRYYSVLKSRDAKWGTRQQIEVEAKA